MKKLIPIALFLFAFAASAELKQFAGGSSTDVSPKLHGPVLILAGGGGDVEPALQSAIDQIRGCSDCPEKIDVAVLRASGADGYNSLFLGLKGVNSVVSFVITDRASAEREDVVKRVHDAELVFFAGGDQCNYVRWIKGTPTAKAVEEVYRRGGAIGGTSAGLAIQSAIAYDACPDQSAQSKTVLLDPFHVDVSLSRGFFAWKFMENTITDTHFQQRDRLGRLLVFLARARQESATPLTGIGVSEKTTLLVSSNGSARVWGDGPVHIVRIEKPAAVLERGKPLTAEYQIWKYASGATLDLAKLPVSGGKVLEVVDGKLAADPY